MMAKKTDGLDIIFGLFRLSFGLIALFFKGAKAASKSMAAAEKQRQRQKHVEAMAINNLVRVITESINIANTSKNVKTIESRLLVARERLDELTSTYPQVGASELEQELQKIEKAFPTERYIKQAHAFLARAAKAKTDKTITKNIGAAKSALKDGFLDPATDEEVLRAFDVENELSILRTEL